MLVAVDDTDSREGMCTTYLLTEIIRRSGLDVIGSPRLVRLNPAIKYKTRGNGALAVNLGIGAGVPELIGTMDGKPVKSFPTIAKEPDLEALTAVSREAIEQLAVMDEQETNPGLVISSSYLPEEFYWKAVREEVSLVEAEAFIQKNKGRFVKFKNGRGIIGAAASLSWPGIKKTYEVLAYRNNGGRPPDNPLKIKVAEQINNIPGTFNNVDIQNEYAAIFPKERTPVLLGVRGTKKQPILNDLPKILSEAAIQPERVFCFETNQATDDHIIHDANSLGERQSYAVIGIVKNPPQVITGSHYFANINAEGRDLKIAAFEPTKEFREIFRQLAPGDRIRVYGTYVNETINVEKMEIIDLSCHYSRVTPKCEVCGNRMVSKGIGDYRCRKCHTRKTLPHYSKTEREMKPGRYDVPVIARRHISQPFELESQLCGALPGGLV